MGKKILTEFEGKTYASFNELVRQEGVVDPDRVRLREKAGWDRKRALLTPLNATRKTKADYHRLAKEIGWKWLGISLPESVTKKTKWQCGNGHRRNLSFSTVKSSGGKCWDCYTDQVGHPDYVDPRRHCEEEYYRLAAEKGFKYLGPYPRDSKTNTEWQCAKKHLPWESTYNNIHKGHGCPSCSGQRADFDNNLEVLFPEIAKQWHRTKNGNKKPSEVTAGTNKVAWWHCPNSKLPEYPHDYPAVVKERTRSDGPTGCPYCAGSKVAPDTSLEYKRPEIAAQWHPTKNGSLTPADVSWGSGIKHYWLCPRNDKHVWQVSPNARTTREEGTWCPHCTNQTSRLEIRIYTELKAIFEDAKRKNKDLGVEVDVLLPLQRIGIEIDGEFWHADKVKQDRQKNKILEACNYTLLRLRGKKLPLIGQHDVTFDENQSADKAIQLLLLKLSDLVSSEDQEKIQSYLSREEFANDGEYREIVARLPGPAAGESFADEYPESAKFWDYEKNAPLTPDLFAPGSNEKMWWKCAHKDYHPSFQRTIYQFRKRPKCEYCVGKEVHKFESLATVYPDLLKDWDYKKNKLRPEEVWPMWKERRLRVFWICSECGYEWRSSPNNRCIRGGGCLPCKARARQRSAATGRFT